MAIRGIPNIDIINGTASPAEYLPEHYEDDDCYDDETGYEQRREAREGL